MFSAPSRVVMSATTPAAFAAGLGGGHRVWVPAGEDHRSPFRREHFTDAASAAAAPAGDDRGLP
jgi:hypothetical protein